MTEPADPIRRIEDALSRLGAEHEPPAGWEARVLAATAPPRRRAWWWFAAPGVLAAAVLALVLLPHKASALELDIAVAKGPTRVRGPGAQLGDVVTATANGGGAHRAVWIYRNETELVLACPGGVRCRQHGDAVVADLELAALGTYHIVAIASSAALPTPSGQLDADVAAAEQAQLAISRREITIR